MARGPKISDSACGGSTSAENGRLTQRRPMPPSLPPALRHRTATCALHELDDAIGAPRLRDNAPVAAPGEPALAPSRRAVMRPAPPYPM